MLLDHVVAGPVSKRYTALRAAKASTPVVIEQAAAQRRRRSVEELIERTPADGLVAGIGGVLYTHYLGSISPRGMFDINFQIGRASCRERV